MIKAIIFDFFDVIRSDPYKAWLANHGFKREGKFLEIVNKMDTGEIDVEAFIESLSKLSGQSISDVDQEFASVSQVNFEIIELIQRLHTTYKTGLLSNAPSKYIREILKENNLEQYFNEIVISSEVGYVKPSKEIFEIILHRLGINASQAVFIDDSKTHIDGAEKVGIKSIHYQSPMQLKNELAMLGIR